MLQDRWNPRKLTGISILEITEVPNLNQDQIFDQDQDLLIPSSKEALSTLINQLDSIQASYEEMQLWLLPEQFKLLPEFSDYGFTSEAGFNYLYRDGASIFYFTSESDGDKIQAIRQMEEHLLAIFLSDGVGYLATPTHLEDLMRGIAKAYRCQIEFIE